jgi:hypothetical protein
MVYAVTASKGKRKELLKSVYLSHSFSTSHSPFSLPRCQTAQNVAARFFFLGLSRLTAPPRRFSPVRMFSGSKCAFSIPFWKDKKASFEAAAAAATTESDRSGTVGAGNAMSCINVRRLVDSTLELLLLVVVVMGCCCYLCYSFFILFFLERKEATSACMYIDWYRERKSERRLCPWIPPSTRGIRMLYLSAVFLLPSIAPFVCLFVFWPVRA